MYHIFKAFVYIFCTIIVRINRFAKSVPVQLQVKSVCSLQSTNVCTVGKILLYMGRGQCKMRIAQLKTIYNTLLALQFFTS
jgi:hypothetical protein